MKKSQSKMKKSQSKMKKGQSKMKKGQSCVFYNHPCIHSCISISDNKITSDLKFTRPFIVI
jgi:tRNA U34 2-thiouridine synthase MnmA/TrmU